MSQLKNIIPANFVYALVQQSAGPGALIDGGDGSEFQYVYCAAAVAIGEVVMIGTSGAGTAGLDPCVVTPATGLIGRAGVGIYAISADSWCWVQVKGPCGPVYTKGANKQGASVYGSGSLAVGSTLKLSNGNRYFVYDAASATSASTVAISQVAYTTGAAALKSVYLTGATVTC